MDFGRIIQDPFVAVGVGVFCHPVETAGFSVLERAVDKIVFPADRDGGKQKQEEDLFHNIFSGNTVFTFAILYLRQICFARVFSTKKQIISGIIDDKTINDEKLGCKKSEQAFSDKISKLRSVFLS